MKIQLSVTHGPHKGRIFEFEGHDTFLVGRGTKAHFRLPNEDRYFSRVHFMVEVNPPNCRLLDLNSRNGTYVNASKVQTIDLQDGDVIKGGKTKMRVDIEQKAPLPNEKSDVSSQVRSILPTDFSSSSSDVTKNERTACGVVASGEERFLPDGFAKLMLDREQPFPGYRLVKELGVGGMGIVYLAIRENDGRVVALKSLKPDAAASDRDRAFFLREAKVLESLQHPNVVAFYDMGQASGMLYFAMEYVPGIDLGAAVREFDGPFNIRRGCQLICQVLEALEYGHKKRYVHRDVKPENLLLSAESSIDIVKVADFGLARMYGTSTLSGLTMTNQIGGTPQYMPPEQITDYRHAGPAADQYSVAATLYFLLTGRFVLQSGSISSTAELAEHFLKILNDEPVPIQEYRPDLPDGLAKAIHCGLAKNPEARFENVTEMKQILSDFA